MTLELTSVFDKEKLFSALSSHTRLIILEKLNQQRYNIGELAEDLEMSRASVSSNINILEEVGLIQSQYEPGIHGTQRICWSDMTSITVDLVGE